MVSGRKPGPDIKSVGFMVKSICLSVLLLLGAVTGLGQVRFEVNAPRAVERGGTFRVEFELNREPQDFTPPSFEGFDVVAGPLTSSGQSIQIVNGKTTQSVSFTYTYVLAADRAGTVTLGSARAVVDGKAYTTRPVPIEVADAGSGGGGSPGAAASPGGDASVSAGTGLAADDLLVRMEVNRTEVYKGEPVRATARIYSRVPIAGVESRKQPSFNGFWTQEVNLPPQDWRRVTYNGKVYDSQVIGEYLLFPQKSGVLEIERLSLTVIARIVTQSGGHTLFDNFFGGGPTVQDVRRTLSSAPVKVRVKELPAGAPADFGGAVGRFTLEGTLSADRLPANSAAHIRLKLSGSGNFPLVEAPKVVLPGSFEQYPVKAVDQWNVSASGLTGSKEFEYPFIARAEGDYIIEPIRFSYFDTEQKRYKTLTVPQFRLEITRDSTGGAGSPGIVSGISKEDLKILGKDIRFIRVGAPGLVQRDRLFMWSWGYFLVLALLAGVFAGLLVYLRKLIRERRNVALVRNKTANKAAVRRLKAARRLLAENREGQFYEEILRALWGYLSDKLGIPVAALSKDNVREELLRRGVSEEDVKQLLFIISECEYARYAPGEVTGMSNMYQASLDLLGRFEAKIKR